MEVVDGVDEPKSLCLYYRYDSKVSDEPFQALESDLRRLAVDEAAKLDISSCEAKRIQQLIKNELAGIPRLNSADNPAYYLHRLQRCEVLERYTWLNESSEQLTPLQKACQVKFISAVKAKLPASLSNELNSPCDVPKLWIFLEEAGRVFDKGHVLETNMIPPTRQANERPILFILRVIEQMMQFYGVKKDSNNPLVARTTSWLICSDLRRDYSFFSSPWSFDPRTSHAAMKSFRSLEELQNALLEIWWAVAAAPNRAIPSSRNSGKNSRKQNKKGKPKRSNPGAPAPGKPPTQAAQMILP